jgi:hypothetical protein
VLDKPAERINRPGIDVAKRKFSHARHLFPEFRSECDVPHRQIDPQIAYGGQMNIAFALVALWFAATGED